MTITTITTGNDGKSHKKKSHKKNKKKQNKDDIESEGELEQQGRDESVTAKPDDDDNYVNDDDEDDLDLMAAAEAWGKQEESSAGDHIEIPAQTIHEEKKMKAKTKKRNHPTSSSSNALPKRKEETTMKPPENYSLHVTQLSYETTEWDVRNHFVEHGGCLVKSVRLVYDRGLSGQKQFRGVAFVDCADQASYQAALSKLHHSVLLNRRINVRPTLSKGDLVSVAQCAQDTIRQKIRQYLQAKDAAATTAQQQRGEEEEDDEEDNKSKNSKGKNDSNVKSNKKQKISQRNETHSHGKNNKKKGKKKEWSGNSSNNNNKINNKPPVSQNSHDSGHQTAVAVATAATSKAHDSQMLQSTVAKQNATTPDSVHKKLTKKERNRRAAIIMGRKHKMNES